MLAPPMGPTSMPMANIRQPQRVYGGRTVTVKEQVAMPPQLLVAVQMTVVVPSGKALPEGGAQTTGPVLPVAVTAKVAIALVVQVRKTRLGGQVIPT